MALAAAEGAAEIVGRQRSGASSPERRSRFLEERADYLHLAIDLGIELHHRQPLRGFDRRALEASERWRARTLIDRIREGRDDDPLFQILQKVRRRLHQLSQARELRRPGSAERSAIDAESEGLETESARLEAALRQRAPRRENALLPGGFRLETLQAQLDGETQVFDLVLGRSRSCLWRITRNSVETFALPPAAELERQADAYLELLADPHKSSRRAALLDKGTELATTLFGEGLGRIRQQPRMLFVGDGALAPFPLAALPLPGSSPDAPTFLIERLEIVQLPSLQMLAALRLPRPAGHQPTRVLAALGDPWYEAETHEHQIELEEVGLAETVRELGAAPAFRLARLPYSALELDLLAAHLRPWPARNTGGAGPGGKPRPGPRRRARFVRHCSHLRSRDARSRAAGTLGAAALRNRPWRPPSGRTAAGRSLRSRLDRRAGSGERLPDGARETVPLRRGRRPRPRAFSTPAPTALWPACGRSRATPPLT